MKKKDIKELAEFLKSKGCTESQVCSAVLAATTPNYVAASVIKRNKDYVCKRITVGDLIEGNY